MTILRITAVDSGGASSNPLSDSGDHSGYDSDKPVAEKEGRMAAGLSIERAAHPPDTPDRPLRPPDKGQTGVD
jgi:hypothetical protein